MNLVKIIIILSFIFSLYSFNALANENNETSEFNIIDKINSTKNITVETDALLKDRLTKKPLENIEAANVNEGTGKVSSYYSVEVFADSASGAKTTGQARKRAIQSQLPDYECTLIFDAPFWRVRVGQLNSRADAENLAAEISRAFPAYVPFIRVVRN